MAWQDSETWQPFSGTKTAHNPRSERIPKIPLDPMADPGLPEPSHNFGWNLHVCFLCGLRSGDLQKNWETWPTLASHCCWYYEPVSRWFLSLESSFYRSSSIVRGWTKGLWIGWTWVWGWPLFMVAGLGCCILKWPSLVGVGMLNALPSALSQITK